MKTVVIPYSRGFSEDVKMVCIRRMMFKSSPTLRTRLTDIHSKVVYKILVAKCTLVKPETFNKDIGLEMSVCWATVGFKKLHVAFSCYSRVKN